MNWQFRLVVGCLIDRAQTSGGKPRCDPGVGHAPCLGDGQRRRADRRLEGRRSSGGNRRFLLRRSRGNPRRRSARTADRDQWWKHVALIFRRFRRNMTHTHPIDACFPVVWVPLPIGPHGHANAHSHYKLTVRFAPAPADAARRRSCIVGALSMALRLRRQPRVYVRAGLGSSCVAVGWLARPACGSRRMLVCAICGMCNELRQWSASSQRQSGVTA